MPEQRNVLEWRRDKRRFTAKAHGRRYIVAASTALTWELLIDGVPSGFGSQEDCQRIAEECAGRDAVTGLLSGIRAAVAARLDRYLEGCADPLSLGIDQHLAAFAKRLEPPHA
jgi:hypothetical protein